MTVQSPVYFAFVLVLWLLAFPRRTARSRQILFLLASYVFYATFGLGFLAILVTSSLVNYAYGSFLRRRPTVGRVWGGILINLALLAFFKYVPLVGGLAAPASEFASALHRIVMPIGISFWTFQALSYLLDIFREDDNVQPSLIEFLLYMAFWPTVLSGPVCRLSQLLPQFRSVTSVRWDDVAIGLRRILMGLTMKIFLATLLADGVTHGFDHITGRSALDVWLLAIGFGFQLYFDFAGYSHIVIGSARLFGITLPENFAHPFLSTSPSMFWTKWHMSLSFWIRDYLFLPLVMLRRETWWPHVALVISMILFGLWHKGSLLFLLWGAYHGALLVMHRQVQQARRRWPARIPAVVENPVCWAVTFALVSLGWILFRSSDLHTAAVMLAAVVSPAGYGSVTLDPTFCRVLLTVAPAYFAVTLLITWAQSQAELWRVPSAARDRFGIAGNWMAFLWIHKALWTTPILIMCFLFGMLLSATNEAAAPFVYTRF